MRDCTEVPSTEMNRMRGGEKLVLQGDCVLGPGGKGNVMFVTERNQGKEVICGRKIHSVLFMLLLRYQQNIQINRHGRDGGGIGGWERPELAVRTRALCPERWPLTPGRHMEPLGEEVRADAGWRLPHAQ